MPDLTEAMRQATEAIPPSGIDLDSIIGDHYRRARRLRGLAVTGGAIAVATALAAGRLLTAGPNPPVGAGPAPSAPTSSEAAGEPATLLHVTVAARLDTALRLALAAALPDGATVSAPPTFAWFQGEYLAEFTLADRQGNRTSLTAIVEPAWPTPDPHCDYNDPPRVYCSVSVQPDGSQLWQLHGKGAGTDGRATRWSEYVWPNAPGEAATADSVMERAEAVSYDGLPFDQPTLDALAAALHITM